MNYEDFVKKMRGMFDKSKDFYLKYWIIQLGLADWDIYVRDDCSLDDIKDEDAVAETIIEEVGKVAYITILSKEEAEKIDEIYKEEYDYEYILLHELLHIKFFFLYNPNFDNIETLEKRLTHQLIDDLAGTMVRARRDKDARHI